MCVCVCVCAHGCGASSSASGQWQSLYDTLTLRFQKCHELGRFFYEVAGGIDAKSTMATALCLSKRLLQARAEAALLVSLMLNSNAPEATFQVTPEMLNNGTGLSLVRLTRFEDLTLDWLVLGVGKCGTTSLQYNLGLHPQVTLKSTHPSTLSHSLLYSSSRFLPVHQLQREFFNQVPSMLQGHPDLYKTNASMKHIGSPTRSVGCSLVADLKPLYEDGTGNMLSSLVDPDASTEHFLYPFLLSTLLKSKPRLKLLYVFRDPWSTIILT